jgi:putative hemolysin
MPAMPASLVEPIAGVAATPSTRYALRLARHADELRAAQALRFDVFNLELDEGLPQAYLTGLDEDPFDMVCEHLIVLDQETERVVGTYRMQSGDDAAAGLGYYGEREFDLGSFAPMRSRILELGRACIHREHRGYAVLNLLWKGIAAHARQRGLRWLIGCSSLTSQDESVGAAAHVQLEPHRAPAPWLTVPRPDFACALEPVAPTPVRIPRLLSAYLALGARLCGPPAIDREFRTIDFLTWLDLESPTLQALQQRGRFTP